MHLRITLYKRRCQRLIDAGGLPGMANQCFAAAPDSLLPIDPTLQRQNVQHCLPVNGDRQPGGRLLVLEPVQHSKTSGREA